MLENLYQSDKIISRIDLSKGVFVIETLIKGGSMHATKNATKNAIKLERPVFTPDIYKLDKKYQSCKQVEGIKQLIDSNKSISYTSENYNEVIIKLSLRKNTLF